MGWIMSASLYVHPKNRVQKFICNSSERCGCLLTNASTKKSLRWDSSVYHPATMNGKSFSKILDQSGPVDEEKAEEAEDWKVQLDSCHKKKKKNWQYKRNG